MAKKELLQIRFRAVCDDDTFKGKWRDTKPEARADAKAHRDQSGNEDHVIRIVTEQTHTEVVA
jgi:hypothetical protein